jgi:hypothetical protein
MVSHETNPRDWVFLDTVKIAQLVNEAIDVNEIN